MISHANSESGYFFPGSYGNISDSWISVSALFHSITWDTYMHRIDRNMTGEYKKIEADCRKGERAQLSDKKCGVWQLPCPVCYSGRYRVKVL